jgi:prepilin-type N-terminal cleavage/methylation domain-containing protein
MKTGPANRGFTLIEMLMVVAIITVMVAMVIGLAKRIDDQGKERLCQDTLNLIGNALEQFRDFGYEYPDNPLYLPAERQFFKGLKFPIDCNSFGQTALQDIITRVLNVPVPVAISVTATGYLPEYSGSETMHLFLCEVPDCRTTLDKIDKSLKTDLDNNKVQMTININGRIRPLTRIIDPWEKSLRYDYYDEVVLPSFPDEDTKKTFPIVTSAGPDGIFDTADDIINRQPK